MLLTAAQIFGIERNSTGVNPIKGHNGVKKADIESLSICWRWRRFDAAITLRP
jgi:hypothetical protein